MHRIFILTCSICLLVVGSAFAHPGHDHHDDDATKSVRTWKDATGVFEVQATFVMAKDGNVQLRKKDSTLITLPVERMSKEDQQWITRRLAEIAKLNTQFRAQLVAAKKPAQDNGEKTAPAIQQHFQPFADKIKTRWDDNYFYVECNGMPDHNMMVGITAWQQQVPIPQPYTGDNAWRIPLRPVPAKKPMSAKTNFFRGAIALAVNGVPIFNPIKNDGRTDTLLAGELDQWGGHCGRADDYHYHVAPVHLEEKVGKGNPVAYALDGFPIYGYQDPKADDFAPLDWLNGHKDASGKYHYHATKTYPYLNGGFHGEVVERGGQVDPQPRAQGVRPYLPPLRGAKITGFSSPKPNSYRLEFDLRGEKQHVNYTIADDASVTFQFVDASGTETETYRPRERGNQARGGGNRGQADDRRRGGDRGQRKGERGGQPGGQQRGLQAGEGPRQPWIVVHADEIDMNEDDIISKAEIVDEAAKAFLGYDQNRDDKLTETELNGRVNVRSAMGGFIRGHAKELDRDGDGRLSKQEVVANAERMFTKIDRDGNGKITKAELEASRRTDDKPQDVKGGEKKPRGDTRANTTGPLPTISQTTASPTKRPNFVLIFMDDMGWHNMGFSGNKFAETPHTDRLAREGVVFTQAYSSAPNCAPTRACLMSGQYTPRHGVFTVVDSRHSPGQPHHKILASHSNESMSGDVVTIAESLKSAGYATAAFGMWNLGRGRNGPSTPTGQGFDVYKRPQDVGFDKDSYLDRDGRYLTDVLTDEGIRFIESKRDRPFFLYLPTHAIHAPFEPKRELVENYERKARQIDDRDADPIYAAMIEAVNHNVGRIMDALRRFGLSDNTMVIFTSDNGGTSRYVAPLNGSKGALYEGGIRVPACVWWSGIDKPKRRFDEPILSMDFYPTLLDAAGIQHPNGHVLDGVSLIPALQGRASLGREAVYWHFPCYIGRGEPASAIRKGDYKLIELFEGRRLELYNLRNDVGESDNLAEEFPDKAKELHGQLIAWRKSIGAPVPTDPNPDYDPTAKRQRGRPNKRPK